MTIKGQTFGDIYRTVPQSRLIETLRLEGYAYAPEETAHHEINQALERWIGDGIGFRHDDKGQRLFDPVEVICHLKTAGREGRDNVWEKKFVATLRRFVADLDLPGATSTIVSYSRTFSSAHIPPGQALRLRMPLPLTERYARVDIEPELPPEVISHRISEGRLEVRTSAIGAPDIRIGAQFHLERLIAENLPPPIDSAVYLRPKEGLIVITTEIEALARRLAGTASPEASIRAFWDYLMDEYIFTPLHYDQIPADTPLEWVMDSGCYDCQMASAFFVALCRARGLPARLVGGHFLYGRSPTNHYWAEVWLENSGWTPFDFLSWDLSKGGDDTQWRDHFYGQVDARLVTECLPNAFIGALGVPVPASWHILRTIQESGVEIELIGTDNVSVYRDHISIL